MTDRIKAVQDRIAQAALKAGRDPKDITLCAATKTQSSHTIRQAIASGITCCGENRVQEFLANREAQAYQGAQVDFIGHLQTNKVRQIVGQVSLIHSVSSLRLLQEIGKQACLLGICQDILLEVNIGNESTKSGFSPQELEEVAQACPQISGVNLRGIMAIPPKMENSVSQEKVFSKLLQLYIDISSKMSDNYKELNCLSMGMSDDYPLAIAQGATIVRVGTALFGQRA